MKCEIYFLGNFYNFHRMSRAGQRAGSIGLGQSDLDPNDPIRTIPPLYISLPFPSIGPIKMGGLWVDRMGWAGWAISIFGPNQFLFFLIPKNPKK